MKITVEITQQDYQRKVTLEANAVANIDGILYVYTENDTPQVFTEWVRYRFNGETVNNAKAQ